ncbi:MAG: radical SAM protein [Thermoplasmata archaeon]
MIDNYPDIAGLLTSTIDHPGRVSLNIYLPYCNYHCIGCHNNEIARGIFERVPYKKLYWELENNFIAEMVIITGGEPTLHMDKLLELIKLIKSKRSDLVIRVDTNGSNPDVMRKIYDYVDGFAIDIKSPPFEIKKYEYTVRAHYSMDNLVRSVEIASDKEYTIYRTVKYPWLLDEDINKIKNFVKEYGRDKPHYVNPYYEVKDSMDEKLVGNSTDKETVSMASYLI